ncbi:MAG: hypothetical protein ACYCSN_15465 [Acidobacteriaceae bacterium]
MLIEGRFPPPGDIPVSAPPVALLTDEQRSQVGEQVLGMVQRISGTIMAQNDGLRKLAGIMASAGITFVSVTPMMRRGMTPTMMRILGDSKVPSYDRVFALISNGVQTQMASMPEEDKAMVDTYAYETYRILRGIFE